MDSRGRPSAPVQELSFVRHLSFLSIVCCFAGCIAAGDLPSAPGGPDSGNPPSLDDAGESRIDAAVEPADAASDGESRIDAALDAAVDAAFDATDGVVQDAAAEGGGGSPMRDAETALDAESETDGETPMPVSDAGDGSTSNEDYPVQLALGDLHSCLLTRKGKVFCWGADTAGQLGDGSLDHGRTCNIYDWGDNANCQPMPGLVTGDPAMPLVTDLAAGAKSTCAIHEARSEDGSNFSCWGRLADGAWSSAPTAIEFDHSALSDVAEVSVGGLTSCARRNDDDPNVVCWGEYSSGELGNGSTAYEAIDVASALEEQAKPSTILQLAVGDQHGCARLATGAVLCWGNNAYGQTGQSTAQNPVLIPAALTGIPSVTQVAVGGDHTCVLGEDGDAYCHGRADDGQLGFGATDGLDACHNSPRCSAVPLRVDDSDFDAPVEQLAPGYAFTCARLANGRVFCWGQGKFRQLGRKVLPPYWSDTPIDTLITDSVYVAAGYDHACAIRKDHSVVCWGRNDAGQLGVPPEETSDDAPTPSSAKPVTVPKVW